MNSVRIRNYQSTMRILALTRYERLGSSSRVRFYQYFPYLTAQGVEITAAPFFTDAYVRGIYTGKAISRTSILQAYIKRLFALFKSSRYDILWIEKELFPWLPAWFEGFLKRSGSPYVVDYDDAVFHRYDMHRSELVRILLGHKIDHVMRSAALVILGNDYLAERARRAGAARVEHLPSVVDVSTYKVKSNPKKSSFQIGWIGSPVTAPYLTEVREAISRLSKENDIHITLIGAGNISPFPEVPTTILTWDEEIDRSIGELFDVGIMPLVDGPFERGKCGYKLVQYMASGLPVVASPVGINQQMVESGINGYLAISADEWVAALQRIIRDEHLRFRLGKAGRKRAEELYNLHVTGPKLLQLLSSAQKRRE